MKRVIDFFRRHGMLATALYALSPALLVLILIRMPDIDLTTADGWRRLLDPGTIALIVISAGLWAWAIVRFVKFFVAYRRMTATRDGQDNSYMTLLIGAPGTGKTASGTQMSYWAAADAWEKLKFERAKYFWRLKDFQKVLDSPDATDAERQDAQYSIAYFDFLDKSFDFFRKNEDKYIPCYLSTCPVWDLDGRMSYVYESKYVTDHTLLPAFSVVFADEIGYEEGSDKSRDLPPDFATWYRYHRQFGDYRIYGTDQDSGAVCIQARRSTDNNRALYRQIWGLEPKLLIKIADAMRRRAVKTQDHIYEIMQTRAAEIQQADDPNAPFYQALLRSYIQDNCGGKAVEDLTIDERRKYGYFERSVELTAFSDAVYSYIDAYSRLRVRFSRLVKTVAALYSLAQCIGFREVRFFDEGNTERSINPFRGRGIMVFPSASVCMYDDHASMFLNPAIKHVDDKIVIEDMQLAAWQTRRYGVGDRSLPTGKKRFEQSEKEPKDKCSKAELGEK